MPCCEEPPAQTEPPEDWNYTAAVDDYALWTSEKAQPLPLPVGYGPQEWYAWELDENGSYAYKCLLCSKWAMPAHVKSPAHAKKQRWAPEKASPAMIAQCWRAAQHNPTAQTTKSAQPTSSDTPGAAPAPGSGSSTPAKDPLLFY